MYRNCFLLLVAFILGSTQVLFAGEYMIPSSAAVQDATVLAERLMRRNSDRLLLDPVHRDQLIREIRQVLVQVRAAYPVIAEVSPRLDYRPGMLLVGLAPALLAGTLLAERENSTPTGFVKFDTLNTRLGLSDVQVFRRTGVAALYFSKHVNLEAASRAYMKVPGVQFAQPDRQLGDGPDIEAGRVQGIWYVIARKAWGDCASGCIHEELSFFTVEDGIIRLFEDSQAMQEASFAALAATRGWD